MIPRKRRALLVEQGVTLQQIADELGVSNQHVGEVVRGRRRSLRVEQAIARAAKRSWGAMFEPVVDGSGDLRSA